MPEETAVIAGTVPASPAAAGPDAWRLRAVALALATGAVLCCVLAVSIHIWLDARAQVLPLATSDLVIATVWPVVGAR